MKLLALVVLAICVFQSLAITAVDFSGNVSKDELGNVNSAEFNFRATSVWLVPIEVGDLFSITLAGYVSVGVSGSATNQTGQISGDLILGAIRFATGFHPITYLGYISASLTGTRSIDSLTGMDVTNFNYQGSSGFMLAGYNRIEERSPDGNPVRNMTFKELKWDVTWGNNSDKTLHYVKLKGKNPGLLGFEKKVLEQGEEVSFTFFVSTVLGKIDFGSVYANLNPKALESVLEINNWSYKNKANNLVLVAGVATGSGTGSATGKVSISVGSGDNQVYAHFSGDADYSGKAKTVTVVKSVEKSWGLITDDVTVQGQVSAAYNGTFSLTKVEIAFKPGEFGITYDPAIGSGTPIVAKDQAGNAFVMCFSALLFIVALLI